MNKTPINGGIYRITLMADGRIYVGQTRSRYSQRWSDHKKHLRKGTHYNLYLQNAWNTYGEDSFEFAVLEPVKHLEDLDEAESRWIKFYDSIDRSKGFNLSGNPQYCVPISRETKKLLSEIASRPENVQKRRLATQTSEFRERMSEVNKRNWESAERRKKAALFMAEQWNNPAYVEKQQKAHRLKVSSPEYRENMSEVTKQAFSCPTLRKRRAELTTVSWQNPEIRQKRVSVQQIAMADPLVRQKISENVKAAITPEMLQRRGQAIRNAKSEVFELVAPDGAVYTTNRIQEFCLEHGLTYKTIANAATYPGRKLRCGWTVKNLSKQP